MAKNTKIQWADHTFNPWVGCTKVGPGCDHCYAEADFDKRRHFATWGPGQPRVRTSAANWRKPLAWERGHAEFFAKHGRRQRVFVASLADVFDNEVDPAWRKDLMQLIADTPNVIWLMLTKRIGNAKKMLDEAVAGGWTAWPNVWIGATVINQEEADRDIPKLLSTPAATRFLSIEPMLGAVNLKTVFVPNGILRNMVPAINKLDWVICGGESGPNARPMHQEWVQSLRDQCAQAGVPFLFKQWGEWEPIKRTPEINLICTMPGQCRDVWAWTDGTIDGWRTGPTSQRVGKKIAGRLLDGIEHNGFPKDDK